MFLRLDVQKIHDEGGKEILHNKIPSKEDILGDKVINSLQGKKINIQGASLRTNSSMRERMLAMEPLPHSSKVISTNHPSHHPRF